MAGFLWLRLNVWCEGNWVFKAWFLVSNGTSRLCESESTNWLADWESTVFSITFNVSRFSFNSKTWLSEGFAKRSQTGLGLKFNARYTKNHRSDPYISKSQEFFTPHTFLRSERHYWSIASVDEWWFSVANRFLIGLKIPRTLNSSWSKNLI